MRTLPGLDKRKAVIGLLGFAWGLFALHTLGLFGDWADSFFDDWLYVALLAAAAAACSWRAVTAPAERLAWSLMTAAIVSWTLGDIYWSTDLAALAGSGTPSSADSLYLSFYPLAYATLVLLTSPPTTPSSWRSRSPTRCSTRSCWAS